MDDKEISKAIHKYVFGESPKDYDLLLSSLEKEGIDINKIFDEMVTILNDKIDAALKSRRCNV